MRPAFYVTSYNDPQSCSRLMADLETLDIRKDYDLFLSDQSNPDFHPRYDFLCRRHGYTHLTWENHGATAAKHRIIRHAEESGYEFMAQISEDFRLVREGGQHPSVPTGRKDFLSSALKIVEHFCHIDFVHWTLFRVNHDFGYGWAVPTPRMILQRIPSIPLSWLSGDVCLFNWPYTGRVSSLNHILDRAQKVVPGNEQDRKLKEAPGSEWGQAMVSKGRGVVLCAHPVFHHRPIKPEGSKA